MLPHRQERVVGCIKLLIGKGVVCERGVVVMFWVEVGSGLSFGC